MARLVCADRKAVVTLDNPEQLWWAEKHLKTYNTLNIEVDGLQQQNAMLASAFLSQKPKAAAAVGTDSPK